MASITRRTAARLIAGSPALFSATGTHRMTRYNVIWRTPSKNESGVMPVGNGDLAAGVYAIENGDLYLLLSKNDAYNYLGDLYKTGRVRIALDPNPFLAGKPFRQTLDLASGSITIEAEDVQVRIWVDSNRPVYHVEIQSPQKINVTAQPEFWKRFDSCSYNVSEYYTKSSQAPPQDVRLVRNGKILWYFTVGDRSVYADDLKYYGVEQMAAQFPDPFRFNTFGNLLECPSMQLQGGALSGSGTTFDIRIHSCTLQAREPKTWIDAIERQAAKPLRLASDWARHQQWWAKFWDRSWIVASDSTLPAADRERFHGEPNGNKREEKDGAALVAQSYNVFRFLMACQSRGKVQVKFNGGLFTQQLLVPASDKRNRSGETKAIDGGKLLHEDDRLWGRRFTYQNQRLLYWPLLASGDYDLLQPFFQYYSRVLPVRRAITKAWFGHDGAYYRENIEPTGAEHDCGLDGKPTKAAPGAVARYYHDFYFTCGLETTLMMSDYVNFTGDTAFRDRVLVPFARDVLLFFELHYPTLQGGKFRIDPGQSLETWWQAVNPAPDIAGLRCCLDELLSLKAGTAADQARWRALRARMPEVPTQMIDGHKAIAPAEKWAVKKNSENAELYPVFPFRCFGVGLGTADVVTQTMSGRSMKDAYNAACWTQDQIHWAYAGNAKEAAAGLVKRFRNASSMCRFPMYGKEGPDSCPDFDHFGSGAIALQRMLVQEAAGKILLLPAWPSNWDVDAMLHLTGGGIISVKVQDSKLVSWDIRPAARKKDVVVCALQG